MTARELYQQAARYGLRNTFWYLVSALSLPTNFSEWDDSCCRCMEQALQKDFAQARDSEQKARKPL